jgi:phytoene synthase
MGVETRDQLCLDGSGSDMAQVSETTDRAIARGISQMCRERARTIYMASFFLPPRKRLALQATGAFISMLYDALDAVPTSGGGGCASGGDLEARTALVVERVDRIYAGEICPPTMGGPDEAIIAIMSVAIHRYQIPKQWFLDLVEGLKLRATKLRFATYSSLEKYLRARGGSIGLIVSAILGVTTGDAHHHAVEMGMAVELTRILRDLKRHAARNQIFLPLEDLIRFRYSEKDLLAGVANDHFVELMKFQISRARQLYQSSSQGLPHVGGHASRLAAATLAVLYSGILRAIERKRYDVFTTDIKLSAAQRARRMVDAWRLARGGQARGWERR